MSRGLSTLLLLVAAGCQEYGYTSSTQIDVFQQQTRNAVDMLIVIDNSGSMQEEQQNLSRNFEDLIATFAVADVGWRLAVTTTSIDAERFKGRVMGGDDEVILRGPSGELDRVQYTRDWGLSEGVALSLDPANFGPTQNDSPDRWCGATESFGTQQGTPGSWNPGCTGAATTPSAGADLGPRVPLVGDLVITEIMSMSSGDDTRCEWIEVTNLSSDTLDLTDVSLSDLGINEVTLSGTVAPLTPLVIGRALSDNCDTPVDLAFETGFTLADDLRYIEPDSEAGEEQFAELVAQGIDGSNAEMGLENARLVFEEPYYSEDNQSWLRDDASLSLLIVSDEDDFSPYRVDDYIRAFTDLKGDRAYREDGLVTISAVVGLSEPPRPEVPSCESINGTATFGARYLKAVAETGGLADSICTDDFAPIITELGLTLSGLVAEFNLSGIPDLTTMTVKLYESESNDSFVRDLIIDQDFTYSSEQNALLFGPDQVPPSDWYVVVEYIRLPDTAGATP